MPALLLTRMATAPLLCLNFFQRRINCRGIGDVEHDAATTEGASAALIFAAPSALVAVPTTRAPACASASAMAAPMPRVAR